MDRMDHADFDVVDPLRAALAHRQNICDAF
jgi:hypothetical protein